MRPQALLSLLSLAALSVACQGLDPSNGLLAVSDFSPRQAEVGDRLEVIGTGFPSGRAATLSFRGDLFRPGQDPVRGVEITVHATSTSQQRIAFILSEKLQSEMCGNGDDADHTTFRGDVTAAFEARRSGAPPVTGTVRDIVLDVSGPAVSTEVEKHREKEAARALEFLGISLDEVRPHAPLRVKKVAPGSRAERAGVLPADVLVSIDGVDVESITDVVLSGSSRFARLALTRGRLRDPVERSVDVQGFKDEPPRELLWAGLLVGFVALVLVSFMTPLAKIFSWIERRVATRLRERRERPGRELGRRVIGSVQRSFADDLLPSGQPFLLRLVPHLLFLGVSAGATLLSFGRPLVGPDLDVVIALGASATALVVSRLVSGGWAGRGQWSLMRGFGAALSTLALELPVLAAVAAVVESVGSLRVSDWVAAQGALPWSWHVFENPVLFVAFGLVLAATFPHFGPARDLAEADLEGAPASGGLAFYVEWGHLLVVSTLSAIAFLGGWKLPSNWISPAHGWVFGLCGALVLQLKCWCTVGLVLALRWVLPRVRRDQMVGVFWRVLLPAAGAVVAASVGWSVWIRSPAVRAITPALGYVLFGLTLAAAARFVLSVRIHVRATSAPMHVNPWL